MKNGAFISSFVFFGAMAPAAIIAVPPSAEAQTKTPSEKKSLARSARPANYPGTWVTSNDYPSAALRAQEEGTVGFLLHIDETGAVERCEIVESSRSLSLDQATCSNLSERAQFDPALDASGKPTKGTFRSRVSWKIPESAHPAGDSSFDQPPLGKGIMTLQYVLEKDGTKTACGAKVESDDWPKELVAATHDDVFLGLCSDKEKPYIDEHGTPMRAQVKLRVDSQVTPLEE